MSTYRQQRAPLEACASPPAIPVPLDFYTNPAVDLTASL